jgi:histidinol dehydrogenase
MLRRLNSAQAGFGEALAALLDYRGGEGSAEVERVVADILGDVRVRGDAAVLEYTGRFDRHKASSLAALEIPAARMQAARDGLEAGLRTALEQAAARVRAYAERQRLESWSYTEADGTVLGQQVTPLDRAGLYVPGGAAAYPSSVLMNAIPAKVAGVPEVVMVSPAPDGVFNDMVLAAAAIAGVDRAFAIGGAQAVAALAYGTETVPAVDKIVGPGNLYVATAKRQVFGVVGIDMIAGPSEVLILSDGSGDARWLAMDLFAQAEHDADAQAILISPDAAHLDAVARAVEEALPGMPRRGIIEQSLRERGAFIHCRDMAEAVALANRIAPEHLELAVRDPAGLLPLVRHAGAIFMGAYSAEVLGDYCAGPNHVLPTARTARFSSPLGVYDFQKRSSVMQCSPAGARMLAAIAAPLADGEGLSAHAASARCRLHA